MHVLKLGGRLGSELGLTALIDDEDVERVSKYRWRAQKCRSANRYFIYAATSMNGTNVLLHRFIAGAEKGQIVDHRNQNTLDCRRGNIRICTHAENMRNRGVRVDSTNGLKGVFYDKKTNRYRARIKVDGKCVYLGKFKSAEEAKAAYDEAAVRLHGEFARF